MAKTSPVSKTIKKNSSKAQGAKLKKPSVKTTSKKNATGQRKTTSPRKHVFGTTPPKPVSLEQQLAQREAELAIINSIQTGLASKLDMQAIYDLIGDKIRDIFDAQSILIVAYDKVRNLSQFAYNYEKGVRYYPEPRPATAGITGYVMRTRQPVMINENYLRREAEILGMNTEVLAGEDIKARLDVPLIVGGEATGVISLQNIDRENAFSQSDL